MVRIRIQSTKLQQQLVDQGPAGVRWVEKTASANTCDATNQTLDTYNIAATDEAGQFSCMLDFNRDPTDGSAIAAPFQAGDTCTLIGEVSCDGTNWTQQVRVVYNAFGATDNLAPQPQDIYLSKSRRYGRWRVNGTNARTVGFITQTRSNE